MIAIVGLIWVHLELKKDVDFLRSQLLKGKDQRFNGVRMKFVVVVQFPRESMRFACALWPVHFRNHLEWF